MKFSLNDIEKPVQGIVQVLPRLFVQYLLLRILPSVTPEKILAYVSYNRVHKIITYFQTWLSEKATAIFSCEFAELGALAPTRLTHHWYAPYAPACLSALPIINTRLHAFTLINRRLTRLCLVLCCSN